VVNKNIAIYDHEAANYDKSRFSDDFGAHLDNMHKTILDSFMDPSANTVLEVGIGTGRFGIWLAKKGFNVIGMDISRKMLKKTKEKARFLTVDLGLVRADVHYFPFRQDIFNKCICINVMDHFLNYEDFFKQVRHVIRTDGSFVFNFSNSQSPYFPAALLINLTKHAMFKNKIFSRWLTLKEINISLSEGGFRIRNIRGCMITSQIPFANKLVSVIRSINIAIERSPSRFFSGSIFVNAERNITKKMMHNRKVND
jgi:ubiquinone/menaquinone biosynthesis C-methylase UbiE